MMVSTTNEIAGFKTERHLGDMRRITVRARNAAANFAGRLQSIFGGRTGVYAELAESARLEAFGHMRARAPQGRANAVIGMCYDASDIMDGITEVLA
jgi:uncharacterized protein YbjQ (UPF0145 family)